MYSSSFRAANMLMHVGLIHLLQTACQIDVSEMRIKHIASSRKLKQSTPWLD